MENLIGAFVLASLAAGGIGLGVVVLAATRPAPEAAVTHVAGSRNAKT